MENKKGTDKVLSIYWFVILILVAGGIYAMVSVFYNYPDDVRNIEAELIINKVADCLAEGGMMKDGVVKDNVFLLDNQTFLDRCKFNFKSEELWSDENQYYISILIYEEGDTNKPVNYIVAGNDKWPSFCEIQKEEEYGLLVRCANKRFYALGNDGITQYLIDIDSVVRKTEKNIRVGGILG